MTDKKRKKILEEKREQNIKEVIDYFKKNLHLLNEPINESGDKFIFKMIDYCKFDKNIKKYQVKHRELFYDFIDYVIKIDESKINLNYQNKNNQTLLNLCIENEKFEEMLFLLERGVKSNIKCSQKNQNYYEATKNKFKCLKKESKLLENEKNEKNLKLIEKIQYYLNLIEKIQYYLNYDIEKAIKEISEIDLGNEKDVLNLRMRIKSYLNLEFEKLLEYAGEKRQKFQKAEKKLLKICMIEPKAEFETEFEKFNKYENKEPKAEFPKKIHRSHSF